MERLNKNSYPSLSGNANHLVFSYPEKVLQFGTGVLLRALPDFYIDLANKQQIFKGRVVMVKSTAGLVDTAFEAQDGLYTHIIKGIEKSEPVEKIYLNASISRCIHAENDWQQILQIAESPELEIIISNTTEVGIVYQEEQIGETMPNSFPAKLLAVLLHRFKYFGGDSEKGLVVLPTELIDNNADQLLFILEQLALHNQLESSFLIWLKQSNYFCNTLVDRIVPGKLLPDEKCEFEMKLGYHDELMIMSEPFGLWAIETNKQQVIDRLQFVNQSNGCRVVEDLYIYKELKLRLLNATHSFACAYAIRLDFKTVKEAMLNTAFKVYIKKLIEEIKLILVEVECFPKYLVDDFAEQVIDRFSNPYIDHKWESISLHYSTKIRVRCLPLIRKAIAVKNGHYENMLKGLEEFNLFSQGDLNEFLEKEVYGQE